MQKPLIDAQRVTEFLPQREPVVMIDKLWMVSDEVTKTGLTVRPDMLFMENGWFTEPGLLENIAQTAAIRAGYLHKMKNKPVPLGFITSFRNLKIFALPHEGDEIVTEVAFKTEVMDTSIFEGKIFCEEVLLASCELTVFIQKTPEQ